MFRNKEIRIFIGITILISLVGFITVFQVSRRAAYISFVVSILLIIGFIIFTKWRYREIDKLSRYLSNILNGDYKLDIRDNAEGELSILKNDIYKVTLMLIEKSELLKKDKIHLAEVMSDISHQLKTPLTSMIVMTDLLSEGNLNQDKKVEFTNNIKVQLERIEWLVTSLLKLSKIDAGTAVFKKDKVNVKSLIESSVRPLLIPIEIRDQTLTINGDENTSFQGDFNWTREGLINVIKNCIEHTDSGGKINITYRENPIYTEILITDTGVGISKEDLPYIFKRFYKGKNASDDSIGIGLAMAKTIIKNQNGDITVKSKKGEGTQFSIKFYKQIV